MSQDFQAGAVTESWLAERTALHEAFEELVGLHDSSRLGYLNGPRKEWSEDELVDRWREAAGHTKRLKEAVNHVYIHVPFCKSICSFCNYERLRPSSAKLLEQYTERVFRSLQAIGPAVAEMKWHTLYFGGGTPSVLPAPMLKKILVALDDNLRWHPNSTRFFEFDPSVFNEQKLEVLLEHGFDHFSFGVQTLTADVNAEHNRGPQSRDIVKKRFDELHAHGIYNISCDFLLGLKGTSPEQIVGEIEEVLALAPRWVDLYYLTPTDDYVRTHFGGNPEAFWAHVSQFHERIPALVREAAARHGYRLRRGHGHNIIIYRQISAHERSSRHSIFSYTQLVDQQRRPLHLLGLGSSARSYVFGQMHIECRNPKEVGDEYGDHYYLGYDLGMEGEIRLFLVHILRDNDVVDRAMFQRIFGMDITEAIPRTIETWRRQGKVTLTDEALTLAREERRDRIRTLLWTVPDDKLGYEVQRHRDNLIAQARKRESDGHRGGAQQAAGQPS